MLRWLASCMSWLVRRACLHEMSWLVHLACMSWLVRLVLELACLCADWIGAGLLMHPLSFLSGSSRVAVVRLQ